MMGSLSGPSHTSTVKETKIGLLLVFTFVQAYAFITDVEELLGLFTYVFHIFSYTPRKLCTCYSQSEFRILKICESLSSALTLRVYALDTLKSQHECIILSKFTRESKYAVCPLTGSFSIICLNVCLQRQQVSDQYATDRLSIPSLKDSTVT